MTASVYDYEGIYFVAPDIFYMYFVMYKTHSVNLSYSGLGIVLSIEGTVENKTQTSALMSS